MLSHLWSSPGQHLPDSGGERPEAVQIRGGVSRVRPTWARIRPTRARNRIFFGDVAELGADTDQVPNSARLWGVFGEVRLRELAIDQLGLGIGLDRATWVELEPKSTKSQVLPALLRGRPHSDQSRPAFHQLGHRPHLGRRRPNSGRNRPDSKFGRIRGEFDGTRAESGQRPKSAKFGAKKAEEDHSRPGVGQIGPGLGVSWCDVGRNRPSLG